MSRTVGTVLAVTFLLVALAAGGGIGARAGDRPADTASAPAASPQPAPAPEPIPGAKPALPEAKASVRDPGGAIEVPATVQGVARVGSGKCKGCHKLQYDSWSGSAHAKRNPPLDCEGCHGPGSEYKAIAVMKDSAKARAAGLVIPAKGFCVTCHTSGWTEAMLAATHAHKPK